MHEYERIDLKRAAMSASMAMPAGHHWRQAQVHQCSSMVCWWYSELRYQEPVMSTNKDQVKGRIKEAKGKIKEVAGKLLGDKRLQAKGKAQKTLGKAQAKFGDVKQRVKKSSKKRR
jgi:uncharacterized protein YjbJ (UPF0337 family)